MPLVTVVSLLGAKIIEDATTDELNQCLDLVHAEYTELYGKSAPEEIQTLCLILNVV